MDLLSFMLGKATGGGGGATKSYYIEEQTVTTALGPTGFNQAILTSVVSPLNGDSVTVKYNGVEYECTAFYSSDFGGVCLGAISGSSFDWNTYPFFIAFTGDGTGIITQTATTLTVSAYAETGGSSDISFTYDGVTYKAQPYETWASWVESGNNTLGLYIQEGYVHCAENKYWLYDYVLADYIKAEMVVIADRTYYAKT